MSLMLVCSSGVCCDRLLSKRKITNKIGKSVTFWQKK